MFVADHDRLNAMMGMPIGPKMEGDCISSVDENEMGDMMQDNISIEEYQRDTASDDEQNDMDYSEERDGELPTQVNKLRVLLLKLLTTLV